MTRADRFQPSRAGIINLWDYVDEEFVFADGRLALRGHNGSGKTKALEVLFPFVLDGSLDARRLDPFSGENRTMKSNLLYRGQEAAYGYVWTEFARQVEDAANITGRDTVETVTLIIGLHVNRAWNRPRASFYVTDRRLGRDFGLLGPDSRPLTRRQLVAALGRDAFRENRSEYQDLVDAKLFGLGRERYAQLLDLLIALRKPMLAKDLDPQKVSDTLTAGLSPLDDDLVDQAARDFENLAAVRADYEQLTVTDAAVRAFLQPYRQYLRAFLRNRLAAIDEARRTVTRHADTLAGATRRKRAARQRQEAADHEVTRLGTAITGLRGEERGLKDRDAYREHHQLVEAGERLRERRQRCETDTQKLQRAQRNVADLVTEMTTAEARREQKQQENARLADDLAQAARTAGLTRDDLGPADTGDDLTDTAKARVTARRAEIDTVREQLAKADSAGQARKAADAACGTARTELQQAEDGLQAAVAEADRLRTDAVAQLASWAQAWSGGPFPAAAPEDHQRLADVLEHVGELGASALADAYTAAAEPRRTAVIEERTRLEGQVAEVDTRITACAAERDDIAAERDEAPPGNDLRPADRAQRPGAPLWRLVRFADDVSEADAAAVEGALYGAGLLTAWVHPRPALTAEAVAAAEADGFLVAAPEEVRPGGRTLADVLLPEEDQDEVDAAVIRAVLQSVALGSVALDDGPPVSDGSSDVVSGPVVVTTRAQFRLGPQVGARPKSRAEFIGATNRAARRRRRMAELEEALATLTEQRAEVAHRVEQYRAAERDFGLARRALPATAPLVKALQNADTKGVLRTEAERRLQRATTLLDEATARWDAEVRRLRQLAAERFLPDSVTELDTVAAAVDRFAVTAERLVGGRRAVVDLDTALDEQRERVERLAAENEETAEALARDTQELRADEEAHRTRVDAIGRDYTDIEEELVRIDAELRRLTTELREQERERGEQHDEEVRASAEADTARTSLTETAAALLAQLRSFAPAADPDLRPLLDIPDQRTLWPEHWADVASATATVMDRLTTPDPKGQDPAARDPAAPAQVDGGTAVAALFPPAAATLLDLYSAAAAPDQQRQPGASDRAVRDAQEQVWRAFRELDTTLRGGEQGYLPELSGQSPLVVEVDAADGRAPVAVFARTLSDKVEDKRVLLEERERTVLEDALLTALAQQIHTRVMAARDLVRAMDADTRAKPMSSGTTIGIGWVTADKLTDHQTATSRLLERSTAGLGADGLAQLRDLIRAMLHDHRGAHPRDTYREALAAVLDYRRWHTFQLRLHRRGTSGSEQLTRKKHSEMSGGEKSAAIHMPLFAAANALYLSAQPTAPRLVALDEAFAGIDGRFTPELLGLTVQFDLDLFMTGHDLWVTTDKVPALAHYDLHHQAAAHTVSSLLVLWDGAQLIDASAGFAGNDDLAAELLGFAPTRHAPVPADGTAELLPTADVDAGDAADGQPDEGDLADDEEAESDDAA